MIVPDPAAEVRVDFDDDLAPEHRREACHVPHGGANAHMLKVSNVNLLCIQCHTNSSFSGATNTPSFHNQRTYFQACTSCHSQIHGSNFDPTFFK